ncbi:MAG TPA: efflux RND transporter periplasmic adaptor subunit [Spirochaetota bacterium]|nr:efflux RND transporter periplasmic adaptor subunit [Spirochaetota bacterium]
MMTKKKYIPVIIVITVLAVATLYFEVFRYLGGDSSIIEGMGTIEVTEIEISSKISGRIEALPFEEGEQVRKNDLLVKLEYDELNAQRKSARANLVNAIRNYKRIRNLYSSGSISKRDLDNAETAYDVARANLDQVAATIDNAVIYSPVDGTVLARNLEVGEMAFPGSSVLTVADLTKTWIYIYVSEKRLGHVKLGQKAEVMVDSFPGTRFAGSVIAISNKAEFTPKTIQTKDERVKLMFAVKIAVSNPDMKLKPGMPADAVIYAGEGK